MYRIPGNVDVDSQAPDFRARDVLGREISLAGYCGRNNLVLFFYRSSTCQTCREEMADMADKYSMISEQDGEVIAISTDGIDVAKNMAVDLHLPYPVISDLAGDIVRLYGAYDDDTGTAFPTMFLIDKNGIVRDRKKIEGLNDLVPPADVVNKLLRLNRPPGRVPFKSFRHG
jgi:thioredoxin-dependent peroxiredoxin